MGRHLDLVGQDFGRLHVVSLSHRAERGRKVWVCRCACGESTLATTETLRAGTKKSCGCLHRERTGALNKTHGKSGSKTYRIWSGMVARCTIPTASGFASYGARGISVCAKWRDFVGFYEDMGECPAGMSIERMDVDVGYTPDNCVWLPRIDQPRNTTRSRFVVVRGVKKLARDVAAENGVGIGTFKSRLYKYGWSLERACGEAK
jgi:hypothetical protein